MANFRINHLDHVAIRVKDLELSASWYEKVLGLKRRDVTEWGEFPIFMLSGTTGLALFPANSEDPLLPKSSKNVKIDHFAFNVTNNDFNKAQEHYKDLGISFQFQDHYHFHSIYTLDPDGNTVELTTLVVDRDSFYK
ncbi:MAG: VOC family protein [Flavobacteriaceae bacterium]|nr:VOC family protein [Flavobacteriaceae bacterium]